MPTPGVMALQAFSALSLISSFLVVFQIIRLKLHGKTFTQLILYMSLCDFFSSIATVGGEYPDGSPGCHFQGIVSTWFSLSSVFWVTTMTFCVCHLVRSGSVISNNPCVWRTILTFNTVAPIIFALVPLSTSNYRNTDDSALAGLCFIQPRQPVTHSTEDEIKVAQFWQFFSFYFWIWASLALMLICIAYILFKLCVVYHNNNRALNTVLQRIMYYPAIYIFCWFIPMVIDAYAINRKHDKSTDTVTTEIAPFYFALQTMTGFLSAIVFFVINRDILEEASHEAHEAATLRRGAVNSLENNLVFSGSPSMVSPEIGLRSSGMRGTKGTIKANASGMNSVYTQDDDWSDIGDDDLEMERYSLQVYPNSSSSSNSSFLAPPPSSSSLSPHHSSGSASASASDRE